MNKSQALQSFWEGFGIPAYNEYTVPDSAEMPYITYSVSEGAINMPISLTASIWYRMPSWEAITLKSYEISKRITIGGKVIPIDGGYLWLYRGSPFSQRLNDPDTTIRRMLLNVTAEYLVSD